jgi:hypothetical protein
MWQKQTTILHFHSFHHNNERTQTRQLEFSCAEQAQVWGGACKRPKVQTRCVSTRFSVCLAKKREHNNGSTALFDSTTIKTCWNCERRNAKLSLLLNVRNVYRKEHVDVRHSAGSITLLTWAPVSAVFDQNKKETPNPDLRSEFSLGDPNNNGCIFDLFALCCRSCFLGEAQNYRISRN